MQVFRFWTPKNILETSLGTFNILLTFIYTWVATSTSLEHKELQTGPNKLFQKVSLKAPSFIQLLSHVVFVYAGPIISSQGSKNGPGTNQTRLPLWHSQSERQSPHSLPVPAMGITTADDLSQIVP